MQSSSTTLLRIMTHPTKTTLSSSKSTTPSISLKKNKLNYFMAILITFLLISKPIVIEAKVSQPSNLPTSSEISEEDPKIRLSGKQCNIYENEALHAVMDRVCELCHDMFSHQSPNMRANCRADCFRNSQFKKCLLLFRPSRASRHNRTRNLLMF